MNALRKLTSCVVALTSLLAPLAASPAGGPQHDSRRVEALSTDVFQVSFAGAQETTVIINGDNYTDLDLFVYDENGTLIDSDTDGSDYCIVQFTPGSTGSFRIEVQNLGSVYNVYDFACH